MEGIYYIAKVNSMWVKDLYVYTEEITLTRDKFKALYLSKEDAELVKLIAGAKIIKIAVSFKEIGIG